MKPDRSHAHGVSNLRWCGGKLRSSADILQTPENPLADNGGLKGGHLEEAAVGELLFQGWLKFSATLPPGS